jgi:hypothetical protein
MQAASLKEIKQQALELHSTGQKWHFHILTPSCKLNPTDRYAFIVECPQQDLALVNYSDQAEKALGEELSPLLHGAKIMDQASTEAGYQPSKIIQDIIERATTLNEQKLEWHHHMLFPGCQFNTNSSKFTLLFEDPRSEEALSSVTDTEPTNDLKQIEGLFYQS